MLNAAETVVFATKVNNQFNALKDAGDVNNDAIN
jgi:hypothetical protein